MVALLNFALLLIVILGLAYFQVSVLLWTICLVIVLALLTYLAVLNPIFLAFCWLIFIMVALLANIKPLRKKFIIKPLINFLKKRMPPISETEREAIVAGHTWWEKDLFSGRPQWKKLLSIPEPQLTEEEVNFLNHQVETVCSMINDWEVNKDHDLPKSVWDYLKKERFLGMVIPKEYGGLGFSALAHSTVVMKLASRSISTAVNTMVPNSLGPGELLSHYGTKEQKDYYLPRLARGEEIPCFALTGPEAGSDAGSLTDNGMVCYGQFEGKEVLGVRLTWNKRYITLAPIATVLGIAFRLYDPDHLLSKKEDCGITLCLVPTNHPGVEIGNRHFPLYLAFMNGPTRGHDVFIPMDWMIGGQEMIGRGWQMLMECLSIGRAISLPALSTACGKLTYRLTGGYARLRKQFNTSIANFEGIEEALADIAGFTYLLEANRIMTAGAVDLNVRPAIASAIAKYHMTELSRKIIAHAMDIHAGHAIQMGPRNILASAHCSIPISITVEGANILTRNLIIFGQGAIRCHPYIFQEVNLLEKTNTTDDLTEIDRTLFSHIGYAFSNLIRCLCQGFTGGRFICSPVRDKTAPLYRQLTRMSSAFAFLSDVCMLMLGGDLKRKERISARLGDILSHLYLASAALKYFHDKKAPTTDLPYVTWSVQYCLSEIQIACDELLNNLKPHWLAKLLYGLIFPWGKVYYKPRDNLSHQIVKPLLEPSEFRDRLTKYCYTGGDATETFQRIEKALSQLNQIDPVWKKLKNAIKHNSVAKQLDLSQQLRTAYDTAHLTEQEMQLLLEFDALYQEIIQVNEFSFDLQTVVT